MEKRNGTMLRRMCVWGLVLLFALFGFALLVTCADNSDDDDDNDDTGYEGMVSDKAYQTCLNYLDKCGATLKRVDSWCEYYHQEEVKNDCVEQALVDYFNCLIPLDCEDVVGVSVCGAGLQTASSACQ